MERRKSLGVGRDLLRLPTQQSKLSDNARSLRRVVNVGIAYPSVLVGPCCRGVGGCGDAIDRGSFALVRLASRDIGGHCVRDVISMSSGGGRGCWFVEGHESGAEL